MNTGKRHPEMNDRYADGMNPAIWIFLFFVCGSSALFSQKTSGPIVSRPVYFDVSPPLGSVAAFFPGREKKNSAETEGTEIRNNFLETSKHFGSKFKKEDPVRQSWFGTTLPDSVLANFEGTPNVNTAIPPDTYGDVGPNHYFHLVNLSFTVFDKTGNILLGPRDTQTLWSGLPHSGNSGDGIVLYDEQADRWFISTFFLPSYPSPPYFIMVGVSQTPDPAGPWYRWEYQFDNIPDYPKFSVWRDAFYMTCNRFFSPSNFDGIGAAAFDKAAMLAGDPSPAMVLFKFIHNQTVFCLLPADCDGSFPPAGTPGYFSYLDSDNLGIYEFHTDWAHPENATFGNLSKIAIAPFNSSVIGIPQKGTGILLDPSANHLMCRLQFRKFMDHQAMVVNHTVKVGDHQAGIRWYEVRRTSGNWSLFQQSTYAPDSNSRWMGSIAMDAEGNIALGYSVSGNDLYPSIRFTGRMKNDPPGQMTLAEQSVIEGGGSQIHPASTVARWGDYSSMTADPSAPSVFWYTQQYYPETADYNWHTRVVSFSFAGILTVKAVAAYLNICPGMPDQLDVDVSGGNGNYTYSWSSVPAGYSSALKNPVVSPGTATTYIVTVSSGTQTRTDSVRIGITPLPVVFAGNDTVVCRIVNAIPLAGDARNYVSLNWTTSGDGTFADPFSLHTLYYPGPKDRSDSIIDLTLSVFPQPPCSFAADHMLIHTDTCSGIDPAETGGNVTCIYPNPGHGKFTIILPENTVALEISDILGRIIYSRDLESRRENTVTLDLSGKPGGLYSVKIVLHNQYICRKLILR
jgi:hypothetical protein